MKAKSLDEQLAEAKELVAQRIKEAEDKQIIKKARTILEVFGKVLFFGDRIYNQNGFRIKNYISDYLSIKVDKKLVFDASDRSYDRYIPGEWEIKLEEIYQQAYQQANKEKLASLKSNFALEEPSNIRNRFGP